MSELQAPSAFQIKPIALGWLLAVGVDLFFNAGLLTGLFDQTREPGLLPDEVLFRRIPIAYMAVAVGVAGLAWLVERLGKDRSPEGAALGAALGAMFALLGTVSLWTAVELTGAFVAGAALVQMTQFAVAGSFLARYRSRTRSRTLVWGAIAAFLGLAAAGVIAQNLIGG